MASSDKDYVKLLQQQIFFLELKLGLIQKSRATDFSTAPDAALDDSLFNLRAKYVRMEDGYKQQMRELCVKLDQSDMRVAQLVCVPLPAIR